VVECPSFKGEEVVRLNLLSFTLKGTVAFSYYALPLTKRVQSIALHAKQQGSASN